MHFRQESIGNSQPGQRELRRTGRRQVQGVPRRGRRRGAAEPAGVAQVALFGGRQRVAAEQRAGALHEVHGPPRPGSKSRDDGGLSCEVRQHDFICAKVSQLWCIVDLVLHYTS